MKSPDTITSDELISDARLRDIADGCKGVTPGPWRCYENDGRWFAATKSPFVFGLVGLLPAPKERAQSERANLAHVARLDPNTVKAMAEELLAARALIARLSADKARMNELCEALKPFAEAADSLRDSVHDLKFTHGWAFQARDFRRARAALQNASTTP